MTLIYRLKDYIGRRVKIMENELMAKKSTHLSIENNFKYRNADYIINVDVKRSEEVVERKIDENNQNVLEKARKIYKLILHLCNGQFMQILKKFKTVSSPIMKTQVILKNPDFKNAYYLWLYLDKNSDLEFSSCIDTVNKRFTPIYKKQLDQVNLMLFSTLMLNSGFETDSEEVKTKEKKAQILTKLPGEIETDPVSYKVEDNTINEFYLNRSKQILKKQFDSYLEETSDYKLSLKKALESTMAITNSLYESFFSINADEDIFSRLIKEEDPADEMKDAYEKYNIANLVRSVKEKDYLNSLELENKWQDEIKVKNKKYLKYLKAESDKELSEELKKNQEKYNKKLSLINNNQKTEKRKYLKQQNKKVQETNEKISEEFKEYKKQIKLKHKEKLAAEKVKQRKLFEQKKLTAVNQLASDKQNIKAVLKTKSHKKQEEINVKKQLLKEQSEQEIMLKTENLLKNEDLLKTKNNTDNKETTDAAILPKTENNSNVEAFFKTDGLSDSKIS